MTLITNAQDGENSSTVEPGKVPAAILHYVYQDENDWTWKIDLREILGFENSVNQSKNRRFPQFFYWLDAFV